MWSDQSIEKSEGIIGSVRPRSCQQKAWHYGERWELIDKDCSGETAFYVCLIPSELK